ncbi:hypothetical protein EII15_22465, partial [Bacillus licheniformis]|uniref:Fn3-like domain-containing protein n=1 Tax=Bacillus licheniformis TaxID=1402 RepID=UPI000FBBB020
AYVTTDDVRDGFMTLSPRLLKTVDGGTVQVPANATVAVEVPVKIEEDLHSEMPNGYFLDGFVVLTSASEPELSIPFVGFRGNFADLDSVEPFIYELAKEGKKPFYYDPKTGEMCKVDIVLSRLRIVVERF